MLKLLPTSARGNVVPLAWLTAVLFAVARGVYIPHIDLAPDEAYYWEWSRHLDWSYYDQGPLLALFIRFGTWLFGANEFGVRFSAMLCSLGVSGMAIRLCAVELQRPQQTLWLTLALNTMLLFNVGGVLMMHDSVMSLFWMLALAASLRAQHEPRWWLAAGLAGACAIMSKYTGVLIFAAIFMAVISQDALRHHLRSRWFWLGGIGGLILGWSPIVYWNWHTDWASLGHIFSLAGGKTSRHSWHSLPDFIGAQLGLITPILFVLIAFAWWRNRRTQEQQQWFLWWFGMLPFGLFLLLSIYTKVEGNWPGQAYLAGLLLLALQIQPRSQVARWSIISAAFMTITIFAQAAWPFLPFTQQQANLDAAARVDGWRELAQVVTLERQRFGNPTVIGAYNYQVAAELAFYLPDHPQPLILRNRINNQYRFWNPAQTQIGEDAILVIETSAQLDSLRAWFQSIEVVTTVDTRRNGIITHTFIVALGTRCVPAANQTTEHPAQLRPSSTCNMTFTIVSQHICST